MDSTKQVDSNLSISSIISDSNPSNDNPDVTAKSHSMLKILLKAISESNAENSTLTNEVLELLNGLKIDVKSLPLDLKEGIQMTAAILKSEGVPTVNNTALQICLEKRKIQNIIKEREERSMKTKYNNAFAKYNDLQEKLNKIRKEVQQIEDTLQINMSNQENAETDRILWTNRLDIYKENITKLEEELNALHSQDIGFDKTIQKSDLLMNKLEDLYKINNSLKKYGDLPPNLLQAKSVLESKKRELEEIENLICDKIDN